MDKYDEEPLKASMIKRLQAERVSRLFLVFVVIVLTVVFLNMVRMFLMPVLIAAVVCSLSYPFYKSILKTFAGRRGLSSVVSCILLLVFLLVPLFIIGNIVSREAVDFYSRAERMVQEMLEKGESGPLGTLKDSAWFKRFKLDKMDWQSVVTDIAGTIGASITYVIRKTSGGAVQVVAGTFVTLFIMFYFFRDGEQIVSRLKYLIPMEDQYEEALILRFVSVSRATIKGSLLIGLIQSTIGAFTLWIFGIQSPVLWWVVMVILSMIPMFGAWLVMHTAAVVQLIAGHVGQAIGIFLVTVCVISIIDNVLRPRLVGQFTGMHDLIVFFAALGGIATFGPLGVIAGPIIAAFFVTILEIYSKEFRAQLTYSREESAQLKKQE
jgi:predicted PurR-regulated permease PerM